MKEIRLKEKDMDAMKKLNSMNGYFVLYVELLQLIDTHRMYRKEKNDYQCALIEYRLTDVNFHSEVGMLQNGDYEKLTEMVKEEMNS